MHWIATHSNSSALPLSHVSVRSSDATGDVYLRVRAISHAQNTDYQSLTKASSRTTQETSYNIASGNAANKQNTHTKIHITQKQCKNTKQMLSARTPSEAGKTFHARLPYSCHLTPTTHDAPVCNTLLPCPTCVVSRRTNAS